MAGMADQGNREEKAVIIGTGVGGGLAIDARVWAGANGIAGEWGHNPLPRPRTTSRPGPAEREHPGPRCYCGRRGCIDRRCEPG